ncbi:hypothetical protein N7490_006313 [Penicillium lividum]|nr:hypothetical protein N7490_006313 [Penicillium lividum]
MASITDLQESAMWHAVLPANRPSTYQPSNIISCDLKHHLGTPNKPSSSTTAFSSPERSTTTADSSTQTTDDYSAKSPTQSTPITYTTAKERLNTNLDCRSNPLPAIIDPEPQQPPTSHSPQLHQTTPSITSLAPNQQTTYASVL